MKKYILFLFLFLIINCNAWAVTTVTDWDLSPSDVFTEKEIFSKNFPNSSELKTWAQVSTNQEWKITDLPVQVNVDLKGFVEWPILGEINQLAINAWQSLLDCNNGDSMKAREAYVNNTFCRDDQEAMAKLKSAVLAFTSSAMILPFQYQNSIKCEYSINLNEATKNDLTLWMLNVGLSTGHIYPETKTSAVCNLEFQKYSEEKSYREYILTLKEAYPFFQSAIDQIQIPNFHPLLLQTLLEVAIDGFPLPYGTLNCNGLECGLAFLLGHQLPSETILTSHDHYWHWDGNITTDETEKKHAHYQKIVNALMANGPLPVMSNEDISDPYLVELRRTTAALRILRLASLGTQDCNAWGLWPKATLDLLTTLRNADQPYSNAHIEAILFRLTRACHSTFPNDIDLMHVNDALPRLERAGAWRQLPMAEK